MPEENVDPVYTLEYVTSALPSQTNDGIGVHVVNDSSVAEGTRVVIYKNTGAGAVTVADSGHVTVAATWTWFLGFTVTESGDYWLRIQATSESLIPKASVQRSEGGFLKQVESYRPGDFAVFSLTRKRLW